MKRKLTDQDRVFAIMYLAKDSYLEYINNSQNSTLKKQTEKEAIKF